MILFADGTLAETCNPRAESAALTDKTKSLFLENYFPTNPNITTACMDNSDDLSKALNVCSSATGSRWANFLAVDYYEVSVHFQQKQRTNAGFSCQRGDVYTR